METERWAMVVGSTSYEVSTDGRVRSHFFGRVRLLKLSLDAYGYPIVSVVVGGRRASMKVHRLVLEAFVGPRPRGQECRHINGKSTDNRLINLTWGTPTENRHDQTVHDTDQRGERHHAARLTEQQVLDLRASALTASVACLAARYGVSRATISDAITGRTWSYLPGSCDTRPNVGEAHRSAKLTSTDVCNIRAAYAAGASIRELAAAHAVRHQTIHAIVNRRTWKHV